MDDLTRCCSVIRDRVPQLLAIWRAVYGSEVRIVQTLRSPFYQAELYAKGRTTPGPGVSSEHPLGRTVTEADGVHTLSNHQSQKLHGETAGHAVDLGLYLHGMYLDGLTNDTLDPYKPLKGVAEMVGLYSGWNFPKVDPGHLQCSHDGLIVSVPVAPETPKEG